jgi:hypothetical protein
MLTKKRLGTQGSSVPKSDHAHGHQTVNFMINIFQIVLKEPLKERNKKN